MFCRTVIQGSTDCSWNTTLQKGRPAAGRRDLVPQRRVLQHRVAGHDGDDRLGVFPLAERVVGVADALEVGHHEPAGRIGVPGEMGAGQHQGDLRPGGVPLGVAPAGEDPLLHPLGDQGLDLHGGVDRPVAQGRQHVGEGPAMSTFPVARALTARRLPRCGPSPAGRGEGALPARSPPSPGRRARAAPWEPGRSGSARGGPPPGGPPARSRRCA